MKTHSSLKAEVFRTFGFIFSQGTAVDGGSSFNQGTSRGSQSTGVFGSHQDGSTSGSSFQQGGGSGDGFGTLPIGQIRQQPGQQRGIATGAAGGDLTQGQSTGIHGTSQIQKLSSSAKVSKVQPDFFF